MQQLAAFRPLAAAGAAAIGASVISLTPAVSNSVAADIHHRVAVVEQHAVDLADTVANPIETWIDTFTAAETNLQSLYADFKAAPFPVFRQVAANWLQYGVDYVGPFKEAANNLTSFYLGSTSSGFVPDLVNATKDLQTGNITGWLRLLYSAFYSTPFISLEPMESIPKILTYMLQNGTNTYNFATTTALVDIAAQGALALPSGVETALGNGLQAVYDSFIAADPRGVVLNALNVPGLLAYALINGTEFTPGNWNGGLISNGGSVGKFLTSTLPQLLASDTVAPGSQNIMEGGSVLTASHEF